MSGVNCGENGIPQIVAYTEEMASTNLDLDPDLEASGVEHLVKTGKKWQ